MPRINTPVNQVRLTNVVVVRLRRAGKQFELACYPNKVQDFRTNKEKDIAQVIQSERVFTSVHKGQFAKEDELKKAFETNDTNAIIKMILLKGEVQVSGKERKIQEDEFRKEVCTLAAERLMSTSTGAKLTPQMVEASLKKMRWTPTYKPGLSTKVAVLQAVDKLANEFPEEIKKVRMKAVLSHDLDKTTEVDEIIHKLNAQVISSVEHNGKRDVTLLADTGDYRTLEEMTKSVNSTLSVLSMREASQ